MQLQKVVSPSTAAYTVTVAFKHSVMVQAYKILDMRDVTG